MEGSGGGEGNAEKQHLLQETPEERAPDWKLGQLLILSAGRVGEVGGEEVGPPKLDRATLKDPKMS